MEEQKKIEEKERVCPFSKDLKCQDCRLYKAFPGGKGQKECVLILAGLNA